MPRSSLFRFAVLQYRKGVEAYDPTYDLLESGRGKRRPGRNRALSQGDLRRHGGGRPGLRAAHIGFDQGLGTHGVGLSCDLDSMEALAAYQDYPPHVAFKRWAKVHLKDRCCVDLEVAE